MNCLHCNNESDEEETLQMAGVTDDSVVLGDTHGRDFVLLSDYPDGHVGGELELQSVDVCEDCLQKLLLKRERATELNNDTDRDHRYCTACMAFEGLPRKSDEGVPSGAEFVYMEYDGAELYLCARCADKYLDDSVFTQRDETPSKDW